MTEQHESVLVVDDDKAFRVATQTYLEDEGFRVRLAVDGDEALKMLEESPVDIVITDMVMAGMSGLALLRHLGVRCPDMPVIVVTGFGSIETAVEAMRLGAADYVTKPHNNEELLIKIRRALSIRAKDREISALREELRSTYSYGNIVTRSERMKSVLTQIRQVTDTDVTILIQGESGTGKELVARALHFNSARSTGPFLATNCSALNETLLESELFGHEKGAFTGATSQRRGRFEEAHTGTLFLDEIGDISPGVQKKLLRVLQEKTFERVGGTTPVSVDTRVVVATNRNLELMVRQGDFREDLYYRLNVFPISLPPLRERLEDIPLLVDVFLQKHASLAQGRVKDVAPDVIARMMHYSWRGNIRELENLVKRAMITCTGETITSIDLPRESQQHAEDDLSASEPVSWQAPYKEYLSAVLRNAEERYLVRVLRQHKGNINQIARLMDVDRKTVYRKLGELGIDPERFRG